MAPSPDEPYAVNCLIEQSAQGPRVEKARGSLILRLSISPDEPLLRLIRQRTISGRGRGALGDGANLKTNSLLVVRLSRALRDCRPVAQRACVLFGEHQRLVLIC